MSRPDDDDLWVIHLRPEGDGPPMGVRMRRFLKRALRAYGLRCERVSGPQQGPQHALDLAASADADGQGGEATGRRPRRGRSL
jgi:hypothetical protein